MGKGIADGFERLTAGHTRYLSCVKANDDFLTDLFVVFTRGPMPIQLPTQERQSKAQH